MTDETTAQTIIKALTAARWMLFAILVLLAVIVVLMTGVVTIEQLGELAHKLNISRLWEK